MAARFGVTKKTRHVQLKYLYMQHLVHAGLLKVCKIAGSNNRADIFTKFVSTDVLQRHLGRVGLQSRISTHRIYSIRQQGTVTSNFSTYQIHDDKYIYTCLLYTSPSPRDGLLSRMPSSA